MLAVLSSFFIFTVNEQETAVKFKFGEIIQAGYEPGLHFKLPVVNNIKKFDKRIQTLDNKPERVFNTDNEYLMVDYFVKWKINIVNPDIIPNGAIQAVALRIPSFAGSPSITLRFK